MDRREQARQVISEVLRLIDVPGRVETQDAADGGISVAIHPDGEFPGSAEGRRSHVVDALQFLVNKIVNRPNVERRWVTIGVGAFRPPRGETPPRAPAPPRPPPAAPAPAAAVVAPVAQQAARPAAPMTPAPQAQQARPPKPARNAEQDEARLEVPEDAELAVAARKLAEKSAALGRYFALAPIRAEDRARVLKAAAAVPGVSLKVEGEGRNRRVVFHPDKPAPMPKRAVPDYGEDEE